MNYLTLLFLGISVVSVFSEFPVFEGACPLGDVDVIENFNQTRFGSYWYIIERYDATEVNSCCRLNYIWSDEDRDFNEYLIQKGFTSGGFVTEGYQSLVKESEPFSNSGNYTHRFDILHFQDYRFVDTDYDSYAVLWTCLQRLGRHEQNLIIMARDPFFDINSSEALNNTLANPVFDRSLLQQIDHKNNICKH